MYIFGSYEHKEDFLKYLYPLTLTKGSIIAGPILGLGVYKNGRNISTTTIEY